MDTSSAFDPRDFRKALSMFATGVTIVTTRGGDGAAVGMTANSFNSVSLDPPMVLWSLAKSARSLPAFSAARYWNVHVLASGQDALSNRFARAGEDKFAGLALDDCATGAPLLPGCSARFQCRSAFQYEGGDHVIFVGEVVGYDRSDLAPLLYVSGQYAVAAHMAEPPRAGAAPQAGAFSEDMLGYLLGRAHYQFMARFRPLLAEKRITDPEFFLLSLLSVRQPLAPAEIAAHMADTGFETGEPALAAACARGLLRRDDDGYRLSAAGSDTILHILAAAKAVEADLDGRIGAPQGSALRRLLKTLVAASDQGLPSLWA
ncbi:flavin reductase family protein [Massilia niastensis]|uniref:flavin reductase family protein n=1 Tax=Massilia niastensis TaxID=544911 RepID=UPI00037A7AEB|nr:flavin reductase family protein [Massilia niastensis]